MNATAGTTVYGAVDPLEAIADVCSAHSLWMHVDVRPHKVPPDTQLAAHIPTSAVLLHIIGSREVQAHHGTQRSETSV